MNAISCRLCIDRFERKAEPTSAVSLPAGTTAAEALDRVLRLPSVCSKRFLTTKVTAAASKPACQRLTPGCHMLVLVWLLRALNVCHW